MNKIEKVIPALLLFLEFITIFEIAKFTSPIIFVSMVIMIIVIDIILVDMSHDEWYYKHAKQLHNNSNII